jgi:hypothetical protein
MQVGARNVHNSLLVREYRRNGSCTLLSSGNEFLFVLSVLPGLGGILYTRSELDAVEHL